ncbi:hypothetical protein HK104_000737 [Borealophlyctis nickersoniae]|nr:hypothetical protein HK104_000737 [Borealophlyctis nickersoniae]
MILQAHLQTDPLLAHRISSTISTLLNNGKSPHNVHRAEKDLVSISYSQEPQQFLPPSTDTFFRSLLSGNDDDTSPIASAQAALADSVVRHCTRIYWTANTVDSLSSLNALLSTKDGRGSCGWTDSYGDPYNVRVQCYPKTMEHNLAETLPESFSPRLSNFSAVLSVVTIPSQTPTDPPLYAVGLFPPSSLFRIPPTLESHASSVSRAAHKIAEASHHLTLLLPSPPLPSRRVLDIGAAPGGWSIHLSQSSSQVVAVDPANLSENLSDNILHIQTTLDAAIPTLRAMPPFDLLVCDANGPLDKTIAMILPAFELLRSGGGVVVTVKAGKACRGKLTHAMAKSVEDAVKVLESEGGVRECRVVWLLANTVHERTITGVKK